MQKDSVHRFRVEAEKNGLEHCAIESLDKRPVHDVVVAIVSYKDSSLLRQKKTAREAYHFD